MPALAERGLPRRGALHARLRAHRRSPATACTRPARSPTTPTGCTRRSAATPTPSSSATTGVPSPPMAPRCPSPTGGAASSRWRCRRARARRCVPQRPRPTSPQLVHVLPAASAGQPDRAGERLRLHRPAVVGLVARVRRVGRCRPRAGEPGRSGERQCGDHLLPGDARRRYLAPSSSTTPRTRRCRSRRNRRCTSRVATTVASDRNSSSRPSRSTPSTWCRNGRRCRPLPPSRTARRRQQARHRVHHLTTSSTRVQAATKPRFPQASGCTSAPKRG